MTSSVCQCMSYAPPTPPPPVSQTPTPNLSTPAFGPATSSPKDPLGTATLTEGLSPLALELEDTPTRSSPATDNHTEVVGVEKGRVSSARRQWQKSKVSFNFMGEGGSWLVARSSRWTGVTPEGCTTCTRELGCLSEFGVPMTAL